MCSFDQYHSSEAQMLASLATGGTSCHLSATFVAWPLASSLCLGWLVGAWNRARVKQMLASQKTCFSPGFSITLHSPCKLGEQAGVIWVMSLSLAYKVWESRACRCSSCPSKYWGESNESCKIMQTSCSRGCTASLGELRQPGRALLLGESAFCILCPHLRACSWGFCPRQPPLLQLHG